MTEPRGGERGSATVWVLGLAGLLALLGAAVVLVGGAVVARHRASTAADLAALAAAGRAVMADPAACATAARVARVNDAELEGCVVHPEAVVEVRVRVALRGPLGAFAAHARARAGPAPSSGDALREPSGRPGSRAGAEPQNTRSSSAGGA